MIAVAPELQVGIHGDATLPTLIYLPGLHGDWTLVTSFRLAMAGQVRFVEFTYPRTVTWSLDDYAAAIESTLLAHGIDRGWLLAESFGSQPAWRLIARFHERQGSNAESNPTRKNADGLTPLTASLDGQQSWTGVPPVQDGSSGSCATSVGVPKWEEGLGRRDACPTRTLDREVVEGRVRRRPDSTHPRSQTESGGFEPQGMILAGGFVRHPVIPGVRLMRRLNAAAPGWALQASFRLYAAYARFRHRHAAETIDCLGEFVANRLAPGDQAAIVHRLDLIANHDPREVARRTQIPVHYLAGLVDPLVPWPFVRCWLRSHCPGYLGGRTILNADHDVLGTAPQAAGRCVFGWMTADAE